MRHTWSGRASIVKAIVAPFHEQKRRDHDVKRCRKERIACGQGGRWPSSRRLSRGGGVDLAWEDLRSQGWVGSNEPTKRLPCLPRYWLASVGSEGCAGTSISMLPWSSRNGG